MTQKGEVAEWSNAAVSKTVVRGNSDREFKSHPLRHLIEFWDYYGILDENEGHHSC